MRFFVQTLALLLLLTAPAMAEGNRIKGDRYEFMSKEDMAAEAQGMYSMCAQNPYQSLYFDCGCVAGAFLIEREDKRSLDDATTIYEKITGSNKIKCANTAEIAGKVQADCLEYMETYRALDPDRPGYCTCVANKMAGDFEKNPILDTGYVNTLKVRAINSCDDPQFLAKSKASQKAKETASKTAN